VTAHIRLHATRYHGAPDREGRGWITWDGKQIASFESIPYMERRGKLSSELQDLGQGVDGAWDQASEIANREGRFPLWEFTDAVEDYPSLAMEQALASENPLVRGLAMLDRRLGKRRLTTIEFSRDEQPFVRRLHALRCQAEGLHPPRLGEPPPSAARRS
jgi:hypothetical protein